MQTDKKPLPRPAQCRHLLILLTVAVSLYLPATLQAGPDQKKTAMTKYESVMEIADELRLYEDDHYSLIPKIRSAAHEISNENYERADLMLDELLLALKEVKHNTPLKRSILFRNQWLQIYLDIFQKYAILALLAFIFLKIPLVYKKLRYNTLTVTARIILPLLFSASALTLSLYDIKRFGDPSPLYMDYQVILVALSGMIGGFWTGLITGVITGLFRWLFDPDLMEAFKLLVIIGTTSSVVNFFRIRPAPLKIVSIVGLLVGYYHASTLYQSIPSGLSQADIIMGILFLGLLEGVAITVFFAVLDSIIREENRLETKEELLKTHLLFLQAQINPHFFYNAINTIAGVCEEGDSAKGIKLLYHLSDFFRRTTRQAQDQTTLREEVEYLNAYLEIEKARLQERLVVETRFNIEEHLWSLKLPLLIIQPVVENAIKHGIAKRPEGGKLVLSLSRVRDNVVFEVSDDGPGMNRELIQAALDGKLRKERQSGIGVRNIQERLLHTWGLRYGLQYESTPGRGTKVKILIPVHPKKIRDIYNPEIAA